jgi:hypothetical protein
MKLAEYKMRVAEKKVEEEKVRKERSDRRAAALATIKPVLSKIDVEYRFSVGRKSEHFVSVEWIDGQLDWHSKFGAKTWKEIQPLKSKRGRRAEKEAHLLAAIQHYLDAGLPRVDCGAVVVDEESSEEDVSGEITVDDLEGEDGYDSERDFYE